MPDRYSMFQKFLFLLANIHHFPLADKCFMTGQQSLTLVKNNEKEATLTPLTRSPLTVKKHNVMRERRHYGAKANGLWCKGHRTIVR